MAELTRPLPTARLWERFIRWIGRAGQVAAVGSVAVTGAYVGASYLTDSFPFNSGGAPAAGTANLWVDTNGGTCTRNSSPAAYSDAAACTFSGANTAAQSGDVILVKGGSYTGSWSLTKAATVHPAPAETVNLDGEVQVAAANAIIDGGDTVGTQETNRIIIMRPNPTTNSDATVNFSGSGTGKVIEDVTGDTAWFPTSASNSTFRYSELGPLDACTSAAVDMIVTELVSNVTIEGNYFHDQNGGDECPLVHADMIDGLLAAGSVIRGNRFYDCATQCIFNSADNETQYNAMTDLLIENNMIELGNNIGVQSDSQTWTLRYNTIDDDYRTGPAWDSDLTAYGNIWTQVVPCSSVGPGGGTVTHSYSIFPTAQSSACGTGSIKADISFVDSPTNGVFHVASGSVAAVNESGNPAACPSTDWDLQGRPQPGGTTCDAGADEVAP